MGGGGGFLSTFSAHPPMDSNRIKESKAGMWIGMKAPITETV
jgi:hypothetical protein